MEENFPGYHKFKEEDFSELWRDCIFVFDTNVLLNLYRYKISTRDELLKIFNEIKDRIWIPHQVALEYHDERLNVIKSLMSVYDKIDKTEKDHCNKIKNKLGVCKERHPIIDVDRITSVLDSNYKLISQELEREKTTHPDWNSSDDIRSTIYSLFDGKIGEPYSQKSLEEIYRRGETRYSLKIPPGYEDKNKKPDFPYKEYGDLVLWCQLIDESKRINKSVILITDDSKKDWFSERSIPRPELIQEFFSETNNILYIYSPKDFMKWSQQYLKITIAEDAIREIEEVKSGDEKYFGDKASKSYSFTWSEVDRLPQSEYDKMEKLRKIFAKKLNENPEMTEEEANLLLLELDRNTVNNHSIKIRFSDKEDDFGWDIYQKFPSILHKY